MEETIKNKKVITEHIEKHIYIIHLYLILKVVVDFELVKLFCLVRTDAGKKISLLFRTTIHKLNKNKQAKYVFNKKSHMRCLAKITSKCSGAFTAAEIPLRTLVLQVKINLISNINNLAYIYFYIVYFNHILRINIALIWGLLLVNYAYHA
jgi:hypothetical protein